MVGSTVFLGLMVVMASAIASAQTSGTATGTLTVNGKPTKLGHAHVQRTVDPFGKQVIRIVLSDVPVSDEAMEDDTGISDLVTASKLIAIEFVLAPDGTPAGGSLQHQGQSVAFTGGSFRFEKTTSDGKTVAGKLSTQPSLASGEVKINCSATFSAPIQAEARPSAEGAAAAASGPGKTTIEFMRAARAKDAAALKKVAGPAMLPQLSGAGAAQYVQSLADWLKPGLEVKRVYEWTNFARVEIANRDGSGAQPFTLVKISGEWKAK